jgi:protein-L-isoaspartate(D-aspartate) O-methyltransferase
VADAAQRQQQLVARLRALGSASDRVLAAFAAVPRHLFLPGVPLGTAYADEAVVTRDEGGVPTSSSSQPSLMAQMIELLGAGAGDRVFEAGAGTGYNAALLAALGAAVTTIELQPEVADAARANLTAAGVPVTDDPPEAGAVRVVTGDAASPPPGEYDAVMFTAGCWSLPERVVAVLAPGGRLVAPVRVNGSELVLALRRDGDVLRGGHAIPCSFMPMRGGAEQPWRWELGGGGIATADADLGVEGRGALDRLLATPGRPVPDPFALADRETALAALLWLGLRGDPLIALVRAPASQRPPWTLALDVLPASLLVLELEDGGGGVASATLHGTDAALRACAEGAAGWRAAGAPAPRALAVSVAPRSGRAGWALPYMGADGVATMDRGAHRWTLSYAASAPP